MQGGRKDILFYSNNCDYCNEILSILVKKNIISRFMRVCVDENRFSLPAFVDRVPIVFTRNDEVISDEVILQYIEEAYPSQSVEIQPFALQQTNYSAQFSFLEEGGESQGLQNKGYTMIGYDQKITYVPEQVTEGAKKDKLDTAMLDRFMQSRDTDLQQFKRIMNSGNGLGIDRNIPQPTHLM